MVGNFSFAFNKLLISGAGSLFDLKRYIPMAGGRVGLITAPSFLNHENGTKYINRLKEYGFETLSFTVHGEPTPETVNRITDELKNIEIDIIIAVGGGSVLDAGKAVSAMVPVDGRVEDYLEGIGDRSPTGAKIPFIAIPTTSGTGSEATMNGVISRKGPSGFKKSIRHPNYIPDAAVLDPTLITSCPATLTAACGMDAFSQLLESFVSSKASPASDLLAWDGLTRFVSSFDLLMGDLENPELRAGISLASYYSGLTLANAGLGVVHGLAGPLGGFSEIPHGAACGTLLYDAFRMTLNKIRVAGSERGGAAGQALDKMARLGSHIEGRILSPGDGCDRLLEMLKGWNEKYKMPRLSDYGFTGSDLDKTAGAGGSKNHPVAFSHEEMIELLQCRL
ncbi:MAG: iron-containing alcohol dehydrogenase [Spirochaetales bacterium]|nr:iron-containing alcohol dehydrogenase [Spirochaetales bacterium]